jgi:hypothetical protein
MQNMRENWAYVIVAIVLVACVVCPVLELFDHWDHTLQTGNDTEYAFVVLALCIGVAFVLARLGISVRRCSLARRLVSIPCAADPSARALSLISQVLSSSSDPPVVSLRI